MSEPRSSSFSASDEEFTKRIKESIEKNLGLLNKLEPHLGCAKCHGPLIETHCPFCQMEFFEMGDNGKLRHVR